MKAQHWILIVSIFLGLFLWVGDALLGWFFFNEGAFLNLLFFKIPPHSIYIRSVGIEMLLIFGLVMVRKINRIEYLEKEVGSLKETHEHLRPDEGSLQNC